MKRVKEVTKRERCNEEGKEVMKRVKEVTK